MNTPQDSLLKQRRREFLEMEAEARRAAAAASNADEKAAWNKLAEDLRNLIAGLDAFLQG